MRKTDCDLLGLAMAYNKLNQYPLMEEEKTKMKTHADASQQLFLLL